MSNTGRKLVIVQGACITSAINSKYYSIPYCYKFIQYVVSLAWLDCFFYFDIWVAKKDLVKVLYKVNNWLLISSDRPQRTVEYIVRMTSNAP